MRCMHIQRKLPVGFGIAVLFVNIKVLFTVSESHCMSLFWCGCCKFSELDAVCLIYLDSFGQVCSFCSQLLGG